MKKLLATICTASLLTVTVFIHLSIKIRAAEDFAPHVIEKNKIFPVQGNIMEYTLRHETLQETVNRVSEKYGATGVSVAVIDNGQVTDTWQYGYAVDGSVKMMEDSKIRIASITKVLLGMNAFKLMEQGVLDIDTDISTYLGIPIVNGHYPDRPVTLRSIFTHTSLIGDYELDELKSRLQSGNIFMGGSPSKSGWSYCNFAFGVAGTVMEKTAGKSIMEISGSNFFIPMGIDAAFASGNIKDKSLIASLYYADGSLSRSRETMAQYVGSNTPGNNGAYMAGGVCISAKDLAKVFSILANDGIYQNSRYLSEESVIAMETGYCTAYQHDVPVIQCVPLNYQADIYGEDGLFFHTGSAYGVYALASYNPENKNGVVVITTGASGACDRYGIYAVCGEIADAIYHQYH